MLKERIDEKTSSGGDYLEILYFDDDMNPMDKEKATKAVIRECKANGELVSETFINIES